MRLFSKYLRSFPTMEILLLLLSFHLLPFIHFQIRQLVLETDTFCTIGNRWHCYPYSHYDWILIPQKSLFCEASLALRTTCDIRQMPRAHICRYDEFRSLFLRRLLWWQPWNCIKSCSIFEGTKSYLGVVIFKAALAQAFLALLFFCPSLS